MGNQPISSVLSSLIGKTGNSNQTFNNSIAIAAPTSKLLTSSGVSSFLKTNGASLATTALSALQNPKAFVQSLKNPSNWYGLATSIPGVSSLITSGIGSLLGSVGLSALAGPFTMGLSLVAGPIISGVVGWFKKRSAKKAAKKFQKMKENNYQQLKAQNDALPADQRKSDEQLQSMAGAQAWSQLKPGEQKKIAEYAGKSEECGAAFLSAQQDTANAQYYANNPSFTGTPPTSDLTKFLAASTVWQALPKDASGNVTAQGVNDWVKDVANDGQYVKGPDGVLREALKGADGKYVVTYDAKFNPSYQYDANGKTYDESIKERLDPNTDVGKSVINNIINTYGLKNIGITSVEDIMGQSGTTTAEKLGNAIMAKSDQSASGNKDGVLSQSEWFGANGTTTAANPYSAIFGTTQQPANYQQLFNGTAPTPTNLDQILKLYGSTPLTDYSKLFGA